MSKLHGSGGVTFQLFAGAASSQTSDRYVLPVPCRYFGLHVITASSSAMLTVQGGIATSSDATLSNILAWSSDTSGSLLSTESTGPFSVVTAQLTDVATSEGLSAWLSASP